MLKTVLTIAGSDSIGGAGIQADLKTLTAMGVYGMSVITSVTAQNTKGVISVQDIGIAVLGDQLDAVFNDVMPDAVKIGMLSNAENVRAVIDKLRRYRPSNVVIDPVMVSTSGHRLLSEKAVGVMKDELFDIADIITPNMQEAEVLCGFSVKDEAGMEKAAEEIAKMTKGAVLIKGGHLENSGNDLLYCDHRLTWLKHERIMKDSVHGTGCTLSSAIAAGLAKGKELETAVKDGKAYVTNAIKRAEKLGQGSYLLNHMN